MKVISDRDFFIRDLDDDMPLNKLFNDGKDLYIEIGSGKGEFISQYPQKHPNWNFIGFELSEKRIINCLKKLSPEDNPNVRLVKRAIDDTIDQLFEKASVNGVFIQHPDPWPKRRHHRRRLFQTAFLDSLAKILKPKAKVQIATDHKDYALWIVDIFSNHKEFVSLQDTPIQNDYNLEDHVVTWFEQEQRRLGFEPNFMLYERI
ncbi:MAG TPA: tRNA (guanosine(46)-N7)-methyltransferase TrmB [Candidatus Cloacimonetes bacterium]|nr:tRNA (guanosine(46)-N7)-methyltransferase TrmB [Candidatus Cloacimonadota bacterium]